jgi:hypothetical protein
MVKREQSTKAPARTKPKLKSSSKVNESKSSGAKTIVDAVQVVNEQLKGKSIVMHYFLRGCQASAIIFASAVYILKKIFQLSQKKTIALTRIYKLSRYSE